MSTPHSKKQRKIPHKVAPLLVGLTAVCFLCFVILSFSIPKPSPFQLATSEEGNALKWVFITPYGETDSSYNALFPSATAAVCLAFVTMLFVHHGDNRVVAKRGLEAFEDLDA